ncbi:MAG: bifunctional riboflavin kinase/FAD synthetase [Thermomicrobiaceae bacterium]
MAQAVVQSLSEVPPKAHVVTIGSFDGVHSGHQHLLRRVTDLASSSGVDSLAVTFDPHPAEVLRPDKAPPRLCTTAERTRLMLACGIDRVAVLEFNSELASQSAEDFLAEVVSYVRPSTIVIGEDFAFGHKRQGTPEFLDDRASDYGYALEIVERINPDDEFEWSSSFVRRALAEHGDVGAAARVLNRPFRLAGVVRNGDRRGRELGYPTANLLPPDRLVTPADGIYAGLVSVAGPESEPSQPCLIYVGSRPTFGESARIVEVFLLEFEGDLYGEEIAVDFLDRIRGDRAFDSPDQLVEQMNQDEAAGRRMFAARGVTVPPSK